MSLLDFLKKKKDNKKSREASVREKKPRKESVKNFDEINRKKEPKIQESDFKKPEKKLSKFFYEAVREPHISEKATNLAEKNQYIFEVSKNYNKKEIKKSVEGIYGVDVLSVNTIKIPAKKRRLGRIEGYKKGYAKAVVKIKEGQKIEIL